MVMQRKSIYCCWNLMSKSFSQHPIVNLFAFSFSMSIKTGTSSFFVLRIVVFVTCLGLLACYYQEKYNNNLYAIIIHIAGNSIGVISAFLMNYL